MCIKDQILKSLSSGPRTYVEVTAIINSLKAFQHRMFPLEIKRWLDAYAESGDIIKVGESTYSLPPKHSPDRRAA